MGSPLVHSGASILCPHAGQASVSATGSRVTVGGQPVALQPDSTTVSGCPFQIPPPTSKPQPCVTVRWVSAATRVRVGGQPVLLTSASSLCQSAEQIPQGAANIVLTQVRVTGV